jgi:hypothetical protein
MVAVSPGSFWDQGAEDAELDFRDAIRGESCVYLPLDISLSAGGPAFVGRGPDRARSSIQVAVHRAGITARGLRADRLLGEAHASAGDPLRLTHLFGISDPTAIRYCTELSPLDQASPAAR